MECAQKSIGVPSRSRSPSGKRADPRNWGTGNPFCGGLCSKAIPRLARLLSPCSGSCSECWRLKSWREAEELGWKSLFPRTIQRPLLRPGTVGREEFFWQDKPWAWFCGQLESGVLTLQQDCSPPSFPGYPAEIGKNQKKNPASV